MTSQIQSRAQSSSTGESTLSNRVEPLHRGKELGIALKALSSNRLAEASPAESQGVLARIGQGAWSILSYAGSGAKQILDSATQEALGSEFTAESEGERGVADASNLERYKTIVAEMLPTSVASNEQVNEVVDALIADSNLIENPTVEMASTVKAFIENNGILEVIGRYYDQDESAREGVSLRDYTVLAISRQNAFILGLANNPRYSSGYQSYDITLTEAVKGIVSSPEYLSEEKLLDKYAEGLVLNGTFTEKGEFFDLYANLIERNSTGPAAQKLNIFIQTNQLEVVRKAYDKLGEEKREISFVDYANSFVQHSDALVGATDSYKNLDLSGVTRKDYNERTKLNLSVDEYSLLSRHNKEIVDEVSFKAYANLVIRHGHPFVKKLMTLEIGEIIKLVSALESKDLAAIALEKNELSTKANSYLDAMNRTDNILGKIKNSFMFLVYSMGNEIYREVGNYKSLRKITELSKEVALEETRAAKIEALEKTHGIKEIIQRIDCDAIETHLKSIGYSNEEAQKFFTVNPGLILEKILPGEITEAFNAIPNFGATNLFKKLTQKLVGHTVSTDTVNVSDEHNLVQKERDAYQAVRLVRKHSQAVVALRKALKNNRATPQELQEMSDKVASTKESAKNALRKIEKGNIAPLVKKHKAAKAELKSFVEKHESAKALLESARQTGLGEEILRELEQELQLTESDQSLKVIGEQNKKVRATKKAILEFQKTEATLLEKGGLEQLINTLEKRALSAENIVKRAKKAIVTKEVLRTIDQEWLVHKIESNKESISIVNAMGGSAAERAEGSIEFAFKSKEEQESYQTKWKWIIRAVKHGDEALIKTFVNEVNSQYDFYFTKHETPWFPPA